MTRPRRRALAVTALLTAAPLALAGAAGAAEPGAPAGGAGLPADAPTTTYTLPGDAVFPEGVAVAGEEYYVGSTGDGTVFRGRLGEPAAEVFLPPGEDGRTTAIGMTTTDDLLLVAGGPTGLLFVYDRVTGELRGSFDNGLGTVEGGTFLNDVRVSPAGDAYVTDSVGDVVYRVPAASLGAESGPLRVFSAASLDDPFGGFNANGLVVAEDGRSLLVVQSDTGALFRIDLEDRSLEELRVFGGSLPGGDGMALDGRTLYVVVREPDAADPAQRERVVVVRLGRSDSWARVAGSITDPTFSSPTTVGIAGERLLVVNSQFANRGPGLEPDLPFTVSDVAR